MTAVAIASEVNLMSAEEFGALPTAARPMELVRGRIQKMNVPGPRHGQLCGRMVQILTNFADERQLGHVLCNDSGIVTERDPDTVRGIDVSFYSFSRLPKGPLPPR